FDSLFTFQDYDVVTGHASLYWDTGWKGVFAQLDAGRYLAGDYGGTITLKRRFANGWEVGGFATFTDVPFDEFGEGSFDKGLFLTIPFNWALPYESRSEFSTVLRPLTRDGGQRLIVANRLYPIVEDFDRQALRANWGSFWE
ncbi:MAG: YjbH domain-containing protein, partial [Pseudomonadota bacterium]